MTRPGTVRLVTFVVGQARFAADVMHVTRVLPYDAISPVPMMPAWIDGVIDHDGAMVPVVDLGRRLGTPRAVRSDGGRLLLFSFGAESLAAAVDKVIDVRAVPSTDIVAPPDLLDGREGAFLLGMLRRDAEMVLVLDVARLFSREDRHDLRRARAAHARSTVEVGTHD